MTRNQYILLFIVLAIVAGIIIIIIHGIQEKEGADPKYIDTCGSFPNENVFVPAAYYHIDFINSETSAAGGKLKTEEACSKNCKSITSCAGYIYSAGTCYLLDSDKIKNAKYYCKHGTGLTNTPNFAQEYRRNVAESILGHGYFKEKRLSPVSIKKAPSAYEKCNTLRKDINTKYKTGLSARKIWEDKSYKIPELGNLDLNNYRENVACTSLCSSLGGYQYPWCYTSPGGSLSAPGNKNAKWGFCTSGCDGYDCFEGYQTAFLPPQLDKGCGAEGCVREDYCGNCEKCAGGNTCPEIAPASWSPSQKSNYYCLYPGSNTTNKCCTEKNNCVTILNPPSAYSTGLSPVSVKPHRKLRKGWIPTDHSHAEKVIYPHADASLLPTACLKEANCDIRSPGNNWCTTPPPTPMIPFIYNSPGNYGECKTASLSPSAKCCWFTTSGREQATPPGQTDMDSYPLITEDPLTPEPNISRSCRTKCTNLNPSDPPNPLTKKWCITDPYYPSVKLSGSPIRFPLKDDDFDNSGSHINRTFWEWGFCNEKSCKNDLSWVSSPVKINDYPKTTGQ